MSIKEFLDKLYMNKAFQKFLDYSRFIFLIILIGMVIYIVVNVEQVKLLNSDVCKICMEKTKAICWYPNN